MIDLDFATESVEPLPYAVSPHLNFKLRVRHRPNSSGIAAKIHSIALRCQIRIEPTRRKYSETEQQGLFELFGLPTQWHRTLHDMLWTHVSVMVPEFEGETVIDVPVPCSYDFNVAATKYFAALGDGDVPICFLFSGTAFYQGLDGGLQIAQIAWDRDASFRLPIRAWKEMMDIYYPNAVWVCMRKDVFDGLDARRQRQMMPTWDLFFEHVLRDEEVREGQTAEAPG